MVIVVHEANSPVQEVDFARSASTTKRGRTPWWGVAAAFVLVLVSAQARAACCDVVAVGEPETNLRICAMSPPGGCQAVLFEGALAVGQHMNVCSETSAVVIERQSSIPEEPAAFVLGAACDGDDVEI